MSDSPMWKRGNLLRSTTRTLCPARATSVPTVAPAGPPPMTTTSNWSSKLGGKTLGDSVELADIADPYRQFAAFRSRGFDEASHHGSCRVPREGAQQRLCHRC